MNTLLNPVFLGAGIGILGVWIVIRTFIRRQNSLEQDWLSHNQKSRLHFRTRLEEKSFRLLAAFGKKFEQMQLDLNLAAVSPSQQAFSKITSALGAGAAAVLAVYLLRYLGVLGSSLWLVMAAALGSAAFGFILPDRKVREKAEKSRELMRGAFTAYMDLMKILLAGGYHTDGALFQAAAIGQGWAFSKLRAAIDWSRVNSQSIPVGLARLASETGVKEIEELAAIATLADKEGTSLKEALSRKSELLAAKDLAEARVKSQAVSEKMSVPTVVIALSFVVFIAYPALAGLTTGAA